MAAVFQANDNRFPINPGRSIQRKRKRNLLGMPKGYHRAEREAVFREVSHHPAVGRGKLDVDEAQRAFSKLRPALGLHGHGSTCYKNSNPQCFAWVKRSEKRAQRRAGSQAQASR
jgi:hypothetical protein